MPTGSFINEVRYSRLPNFFGHKHISDCKHPMMSADWKPIWMREHRPPMFVTDKSEREEFQQMRKEEFSMGMSLYVLRLSVILKL